MFIQSNLAAAERSNVNAEMQTVCCLAGQEQLIHAELLFDCLQGTKASVGIF